jgi:hypothetical protein
MVAAMLLYNSVAIAVLTNAGTGLMPYRFDTASRLQHPTYVVSVKRRLVAIATVLTLCVGNLAVCAGWQATAEARLACCQDESTCPMHESDSHHSAVKHSVTQTQADDCCAGSERSDSATTTSTFALSAVVTFTAAILPVVADSNTPALQDWRAFVRLPVPPIPRHLRLSVLLV